MGVAKGGPTVRDAKVSDSEEMSKAIDAKLQITNRLLAILVARADQRQAIPLLSSAGLQSTEIAVAVGMTPNAVRVALHRHRKATASIVVTEPDLGEQP